MKSFSDYKTAIFKSSSQDHDRHNGSVEILRPLKLGEEVDKEVGKMYKCRSPIGEFDAFADELSFGSCKSQ